MRVLLVSYELPILENIRSWDTYLTYFLDKYLRLNNIEVINICFKKDNPIPDIPKIDFIICITRISYLIEMGLINILKERSNNNICCYGDIVYSKKYDIGQSIFSVLCGEDLDKIKYYSSYWCGDDKYLYPEKDPDKFYILLDHIHYSSTKYHFIYDVYRLALERLSKKYPIDVKIIADPNVRDFGLNNHTYTRSKNKWLDIISYYRKAYLYCVTHLELGGLSVMETAWCGASVIIPDNYICDVLGSQVKSYRWLTGRSDGIYRCWNDVKDNNVDSLYSALERSILEYDIEKNIKLARARTWDDVVKKIVERMS